MKIKTHELTRRYPMSYGYKVEVSIRRENDIAYVDVHAPIYLNTEWTMPHCYSSKQFTDDEILKDSDFTKVMLAHYGDPK